MNIVKEIISIIQKANQLDYKIKLENTLEIVTAYRDISEHPELIDSLKHLIVIFSKQEKHIQQLSSRESQILNLIGLGFKSREIALMLEIREATVSTHRKNMIKKLNISGMGQLQNFAYQYTQGQIVK
jgi:DNA-binding NarL/FixJ family response regulator|tara:strand:- start:44551 stop:44934 length:384 start_codon:yes stop_codon:yes gene_type:complete